MTQTYRKISSQAEAEVHLREYFDQNPELAPQIKWTDEKLPTIEFSETTLSKNPDHWHFTVFVRKERSNWSVSDEGHVAREMAI